MPADKTLPIYEISFYQDCIFLNRDHFFTFKDVFKKLLEILTPNNINNDHFVKITRKTLTYNDIGYKNLSKPLTLTVKQFFLDETIINKAIWKNAQEI